MEKLAEISDEEIGEEDELTEEEIQELQEIIETLPPGHDILERLKSRRISLTTRERTVLYCLPRLHNFIIKLKQK